MTASWTNSPERESSALSQGSNCRAAGVAIMLTVLGISLFGDALRDAIDPKLRDR